MAYLYRAIDEHGAPVDFLLTAKRDLDAAKRFFRKMLEEAPLLAPDRIGTDGAGSYPPAIAAARKDGLLARAPLHYVTKHLQQGIESDHFRVKRPMPQIDYFQASTRRGGRSRALRRCCGCAKVLALRAPGRCASRTGCSRSASVFRRLTKRKTGAAPALHAAYVRVCDRPGGPLLQAEKRIRTGSGHARRPPPAATRCRSRTWRPWRAGSRR